MLATAFKNTVIDELIASSISCEIYRESQFSNVWEHTPDNSPLRKLLVDCAICYDTAERLAEGIESRPMDFNKALVMGQAKFMGGGKRAYIGEKCGYHFHENGPHRYACDSWD
jgi:hypothetical protein